MILANYDGSRGEHAREKDAQNVDPMLAWGIVLLAAALLLVALEIFLPSAGLISVVAGLVGIAGIVCLFQVKEGGAVWGFAGILTILILVPTILVFGFKVLPATPFGKRLLFGESGKHEPVIPETRGSELEPLLGAEGEAVTDLRPVGICRIEGQRIDVLSEVAFVARGTRVRVTAVEGSQVRVRPRDA